jgi:hypothetical protein
MPAVASPDHVVLDFVQALGVNPHNVKRLVVDIDDDCAVRCLVERFVDRNEMVAATEIARRFAPSIVVSERVAADLVVSPPQERYVKWSTAPVHIPRESLILETEAPSIGNMMVTVSPFRKGGCDMLKFEAASSNLTRTTVRLLVFGLTHWLQTGRLEDLSSRLEELD